MISVTIDSSGLNAAIAKALEFSKRTPAQMCNTVALEVAIAAKNNTPFVPVSRIDTELDVIATPVIGKRCKPLKNKKTFSGGATNGDVPLAVLIVQARANPSSIYNQRTNSRYAMSSPFKGVSREAGRIAAAAAVHRMIASRHSSPHFLQAGWLEPIDLLRPFSVNKYRQSLVMPTGGQSNFSKFGDAKPAVAGQLNTACTIENNIGYDGKNAASFNEALLKYGTEPLQRAVDNEGLKAMNYYWSKAGAEMEREFNKTAS
jgi:hypothetical protein